MFKLIEILQFYFHIQEEKYSPPEEKPEDISQQYSDIKNQSNGESPESLSGKSSAEPLSQHDHLTSDNENQKAKKEARSFAKFIANQIMDTQENKRRKLKNDIIKLLSKYIDEE